MTIPSLHAALALLIAASMFAGFVRGNRVEIVSLLTIGAIALALYAFPLPGETKYAGLTLAFEGFGHQALVTICALMIIGRGLVVTGALDPAARALISVWRVSRNLGMLVTVLLCLGMSMVVNDTPVLVLMIPIMAQVAANGGWSASKTLIPLNAAILIGGMSTSIGTSTNLLVVSLAQDQGLDPISVFEFTPIVLIAALIAVPYIWIVMPRLLPDRQREETAESRLYLAKLRIGTGSPAYGKLLDEARAMAPEGVKLWLPGHAGQHIGRRINARGNFADLQETARRFAADLAPSLLLDRIRGDGRAADVDLVVAELLVGPDSRLIGLTPQTAGFQNVALIGVHQTRRPIHETRPASIDAELAEGDVLLMLGERDMLSELGAQDGLLMLEGGQEIARSAKARLSLAILAGAVGLASLGLVPIAISALAGAILMFITGCVRFERVGRALSARVIVLVAASIALGKFVLVSGAAAWMGALLSQGLQFLPPAGVLAAVMLFVTVLTNFASNTTAAAVGTPIAFNIAETLGLPAEPLVLAVLFGCNLCYATPVAYQTNMMVMAEGEYTFADYLRSGIPLVVIMVVALSVTLTMWYGI
jgi:di/tricarboxylate transporter